MSHVMQWKKKTDGRQTQQAGWQTKRIRQGDLILPHTISTFHKNDKFTCDNVAPYLEGH